MENQSVNREIRSVIRPLLKDADDAGIVIGQEGLAWFERFSDLRELLRTLIEEKENVFKGWGLGPNPSAHRHYATGYVALALGERDLAIEHLLAAYEWYRQHDDTTYLGGVYSHLLVNLTTEIQALPDDEGPK